MGNTDTQDLMDFVAALDLLGDADDDNGGVPASEQRLKDQQSDGLEDFEVALEKLATSQQQQGPAL